MLNKKSLLALAVASGLLMGNAFAIGVKITNHTSDVVTFQCVGDCANVKELITKKIEPLQDPLAAEVKPNFHATVGLVTPHGICNFKLSHESIGDAGVLKVAEAGCTGETFIGTVQVGETTDPKGFVEFSIKAKN